MRSPALFALVALSVLTATPAQGGPIGIRVLSATYTTTLATTVANGEVGDLTTARTVRGPVPAHDGMRISTDTADEWASSQAGATAGLLAVETYTTAGGMGEKSRLDWLTRQFAKVDIQLVVRSTDFNRFQDKLRKGNVQLYYLGWNADYPDPENFFFLLDGNESKVAKGGENASNYANPEFDRLFARMKNMDNTPERLAIIRQMNQILNHDAPWVFGLHPKSYTLGHRWLKNRKPNDVGNNILKYQRIDVADRSAARREWNRPQPWPLAGGLLLLALAIVPAVVGYRRRERRAAVT